MDAQEILEAVTEMKENIKTLSDENLTKELAFAIAFDMQDPIGGMWLDLLEEERDRRRDESG